MSGQRRRSGSSLDEFPEGVPDMDEMMKDLPNEYLPEMDADGNFPKEEIKKTSKSRAKDEV